MLKIIGLEFMQLLRKPVWLSIFALLLVVSIILPRANIVDLTIVPGMVYYIMIMTLLLSVYGAERARMQSGQHLEESFSVTPLYRKYVLGELLHWLFLSFIIYLLFYIAVLGYVASVHHNIAIESIYESIHYTLLCWFLPFFYSIIIGFVVYSRLPNIYSYLLIILIWFLTMPYNSMIGILPRKLGGWMINGDPNIIYIFSSAPLESLEVNKGYYLQRLFMLLILLTAYILVRYRRTIRIKVVSVSIVAISLLIPIFSPYVPYITGDEGLGSAVLTLPNGKEISKNNYKISKYSFHIRHGESNHDLKYTVDLEVQSEDPLIQLTLLEDFKVKSIQMNDQQVMFKRMGSLVELTLPENNGTLTMNIETDSYSSVGPATLQLIATTPWYPMIPSEALDPYRHGVKENYEIYWESSPPNKIWSNLNLTANNQWEGNTYGPTILMGRFSESEQTVYPSYHTLERIYKIKSGLQEIFEENNKKYQANKEMPDRIYFVSTFYGLQANPDEAYIYPDVYPNEDIRRVFFMKEGER